MRKLFNTILLIVLSVDVFSQITLKDYAVITVEDTYKTSQHGTQTYFWIVPIDSITSFKITVSRLFLSDFSVNNLEDCCAGKPVDPVVVNQTSNFKLDNDYLSSLDGLKKLILQRRRKLQTITKKWGSGQEEAVKIFATAIKGKFCSCNYHPIGQQRTGYKGIVYVPKSSFSHYEEFWASPKAKYLLQQDFSMMDLDIIPN